ncbi:MAG: PucR family transcriptional regulator [Clostridiales bacterium]|nr:PucR family transcriptional regulator [Clostridiales bacterium]
MVITVESLFKLGMESYHMKLIAGVDGLDNPVHWVHISEETEITKFLHGREMVFTVGMQNKDKNWLLQFAKNLYAANTSAFVVNIGPYITEIPEEVIGFCNEKKMPLFTIPWDVRLVDITHKFCEKIMEVQNRQTSLEATVKNILFKMDDLAIMSLHMEHWGFPRDGRYCVLCICYEKVSDAQEEKLSGSLKLVMEKYTRSLHKKYASFFHNQMLVVLLNDYSDLQIKSLTENLLTGLENEKAGKKIHIGISGNQVGFEAQSENYENAQASCKLAVKKKEKYVFYEELDMYKLLMAVKNKELLKVFYESKLSKIRAYDEQNNTRLLELLEMYLICNGNSQMTADKLYVHRNTVNNQLKKIESLTGADVFDLDVRMKYKMAFYIEKLL